MLRSGEFVGGEMEKDRIWVAVNMDSEVPIHGPSTKAAMLWRSLCGAIGYRYSTTLHP